MSQQQADSFVLNALIVNIIPSSVMQTLRSLVGMNENLKKQEQQFRGHCKVCDSTPYESKKRTKQKTTKINEDKINPSLYHL